MSSSTSVGDGRKEGYFQCHGVAPTENKSNYEQFHTNTSVKLNGENGNAKTTDRKRNKSCSINLSDRRTLKYSCICSNPDTTTMRHQ